MSAIALKLRNQAKFPVQVALHRLVWVVCAFIGAPVAIAARYGKAGLTAFQWKTGGDPACGASCEHVNRRAGQRLQVARGEAR